MNKGSVLLPSFLQDKLKEIIRKDLSDNNDAINEAFETSLAAAANLVKNTVDSDDDAQSLFNADLVASKAFIKAMEVVNDANAKRSAFSKWVDFVHDAKAKRSANSFNSNSIVKKTFKAWKTVITAIADANAAANAAAQAVANALSVVADDNSHIVEAKNQSKFATEAAAKVFDEKDSEAVESTTTANEAAKNAKQHAKKAIESAVSALKLEYQRISSNSSGSSLGQGDVDNTNSSGNLVIATTQKLILFLMLPLNLAKSLKNFKRINH